MKCLLSKINRIIPAFGEECKKDMLWEELRLQLSLPLLQSSQTTLGGVNLDILEATVQKSRRPEGTVYVCCRADGQRDFYVGGQNALKEM